MKITKESLQAVIEEELENTLKEQADGLAAMEKAAIAKAEKEGWEQISDKPTKIKGRNLKTKLHQAKLNLALAGAIKAGKKVTRPVIAIDGITGSQTRQAVADLRLLVPKEYRKRTPIAKVMEKYAKMVTGGEPLKRAAAALVVDEEFKTNPSLVALDKALKGLAAPAQRAVAKTGASQPGAGVPISPMLEGQWYDIKVKGSKPKKKKKTKGPQRVKKMPNIPGEPGGPWDKSVATMEEGDKMHRDPSDEDCEDWVDLIAIASALKMSKRAIEALRKEAAEGGCREVLDEDTLGMDPSAESSVTASETAGGVTGIQAPTGGQIYQVQADSDK